MKKVIFAIFLFLLVFSATGQDGIENKFSLAIQTGLGSAYRLGSLLQNINIGFFTPLGEKIVLQTTGTLFGGYLDSTSDPIRTFGFMINGGIVFKAFEIRDVDFSLGPYMIFGQLSNNTVTFDIGEGKDYISNKIERSIYCIGIRIYSDVPITDYVSVYFQLDLGLNQGFTFTRTYNVQGDILTESSDEGFMSFGIPSSALGIRIRL